MVTFTISIPEDRVRQLEEVAARFSVSMEELVRISVEDLLAQPEEAFQRAMDHVLQKKRRTLPAACRLFKQPERAGKTREYHHLAST